MWATEGHCRSKPARSAIIIATAIIVALLTACAPGGTSAEDGHRLATLKAEPLLEQLEDLGTLLHASNEAGAEDGPAGVENPTSVARTYRLDNNQPHAAGIEVASLAHAHGWNGALSCAFPTGAVFSGFKKFERWDAHLSATISNRLGDTRLVITLETPHVSRRDAVVQITMPGSPTSLQISDRCS